MPTNTPMESKVEAFDDDDLPGRYLSNQPLEQKEISQGPSEMLLTALRSAPPAISESKADTKKSVDTSLKTSNTALNQHFIICKIRLLQSALAKLSSDNECVLIPNIHPWYDVERIPPGRMIKPETAKAGILYLQNSDRNKSLYYQVIDPQGEFVGGIIENGQRIVNLESILKITTTRGHTTEQLNRNDIEKWIFHLQVKLWHSQNQPILKSAELLFQTKIAKECLQRLEKDPTRKTIGVGNVVAFDDKNKRGLDALHLIISIDYLDAEAIQRKLTRLELQSKTTAEIKNTPKAETTRNTDAFNGVYPALFVKIPKKDSEEIDASALNSQNTTSTERVSSSAEAATAQPASAPKNSDPAPSSGCCSIC